MGPGQNFLTRVGSIFYGSGWVSHLCFGLEFGKFQLKMSNFSNFFPAGQKKSLDPSLLGGECYPMQSCSQTSLRCFGLACGWPDTLTPWGWLLSKIFPSAFSPLD